MRLKNALSLSLLVTALTGLTHDARAMKSRLKAIQDQQKLEAQARLTAVAIKQAPTLTANKDVKDALDRQDFSQVLKLSESLLVGGGAPIHQNTFDKIQGGGTTAANLEKHLDDILLITGQTNIKDGVTDLQNVLATEKGNVTTLAGNLQHLQKDFEDLGKLIGGKDRDPFVNANAILTATGQPDLTASVDSLQKGLETLGGWVDDTATTVKEAKQHMDAADALDGDASHTFLARAKQLRTELTNTHTLIRESQKIAGGTHASFLDNMKELQQTLFDQLLNVVKSHQTVAKAKVGDTPFGNALTQPEIDIAQRQFPVFVEVAREKYENAGATIVDIANKVNTLAEAEAMFNAIEKYGTLSLERLLELNGEFLS